MKKPLPRSAVFALIVSTGLAILAAGWLVAVRPLGHKAASLRDQTASVQQQIANDEHAVAAAKGGVATPTIKVANLYKLATAMPSSLDLPDVLLELSRTAKAAKVTLDSLTPNAPVPSPTGSYSKVAITMTATGGYFAVTDLIHRLRSFVTVDHGALEANGRLFSVDAVTLTPLGTHSVSAQLTLGTYVYGATAPAASAAASTTTTGTTTTTPAPSGPSAAGAP